MDPASIDLRSISCRGVKSFNLFQKPSLSAAVSVGGQKKRTAPDPNGGGSPEWAESFRFDLDPGRAPGLSLRIDVVAQGNLPVLLPDRVVGRASVPVADLLREGADGSVRHVSYRVEGTDGRPNGVVSFSFNVNREAIASPVGSGANRPPLPPPRQHDPVMAFPAAGHYPPPRQHDPAISSAAAAGFHPPLTLRDPTTAPFQDRYPPPRQQYPVTSSAATGYYPPPGQRDPLTPSAGHYPPPRQHDPAVSSRAADFYPPPISSEVEERQLYPAPRQREPVTCYPPRAGEFGYYLPTAPAGHAAYPAPSAPPEPDSCYPPPRAACCYPAPDAYGPDGWDRRLC